MRRFCAAPQGFGITVAPGSFGAIPLLKSITIGEFLNVCPAGIRYTDVVLCNIALSEIVKNRSINVCKFLLEIMPLAPDLDSWIEFMDEAKGRIADERSAMDTLDA